MNKIIENLKFKKIIIIYLILLVVSIISITLFLGNKYFNKIEYLYNYHKVNEMFEEDYDLKDIEDSLSKLSKSSNDIVDIVIINNKDIIFSTNNVYKNDLVRIDNTNNYYQDNNDNVYKLANKKEFILSLFSLDEYEDDYYDEFNINNKDYVMTYSKNNHTNDKIIIINKINEVPSGTLYLKISLAIMVLFFMLYWIITSLMIYQNALKIKLNPYLWGIITLFTNIIGVIIYLIYKNNRITCNKCSTSNNKNNIYCTSCGNKINKCCTKCHTIINDKDKYCRSCGEKI